MNGCSQPKWSIPWRYQIPQGRLMAKPPDDPINTPLTPIETLVERAMEEETSPKLAAERAVDAHRGEVAVRLRALLERYNLDAQEDGELVWPKLALALAFEHEAAFQEAENRSEGPGAPKKWTRGLELLLAAQVNERRADKYSLADACKRLIKGPPWVSWNTSMGGHTLKSSTLVQRYKAITKAEPELSWNVIKRDPSKLRLDVFKALLENPDVAKHGADAARAKHEAEAATAEFERRIRRVT